MTRDVTVLGPQAAPVGFQVTSPAGSATQVSRCGTGSEGRAVLEELRAKAGGRQKPPSLLGPGPVPPGR